MQRIVILGNGGSGKSTLARRLGERLDLPVTHLDALFWRPGWTKPDEAEFRGQVDQITLGDRWVCEGNYARQTFDLRLPRADLVISLETAPALCLWRVVRRSLNWRDRIGHAEGCNEKFDAEYLTFLRYIWDFERKSRPAIEALLREHGAHLPVRRLKDRRRTEAFLAALS